MKRIASIDALRGFTILAMILCSAINWGSGLPAWMFHCQTPPPDFAFHPEVRGLTWVDLVFPFFIFTMGAALPIALGKKLQKGVTMPEILRGIAKRWIILVLFSLAIGAANVSPAPYSSWFKPAMWFALFAALVRVDRKWINWTGWAIVAGLVALEWWLMGVEPSLANKDCIIMLLAHASLMGSLIWLLTRNSLLYRAMFLAAVIIARLCGFEFTQYLVIVLAGSIAGDFILSPGTRCTVNWRSGIATLIAFTAVVLQLWLLFVRQVEIDLAATIGLGAAFTLLMYRQDSAYTKIGLMGFALLVAGIAIDPMCGGLAKEYCNLAFLLVSGGQAALSLCVMMWLEELNLLSKLFTYSGQNPMIAYSIAWFVIFPFLYFIKVGYWMVDVCSRNPWLGFLQGIVIAFLTAIITAVFTRYKIFMRS